MGDKKNMDQLPVKKDININKEKCQQEMKSTGVKKATIFDVILKILDLTPDVLPSVLSCFNEKYSNEVKIKEIEHRNIVELTNASIKSVECLTDIAKECENDECRQDIAEKIYNIENKLSSSVHSVGSGDNKQA